MKEIEVKILNVESSKIRLLLKKNGAKFKKKVFQQNFLYANDYTSRKNVVVRIRKEGNNAMFTVKGKAKISQGHKIRDEYEFSINYELAVDMMKTMGFKLIRSVELKREYWILKNCSVEICQLPKLPTYIEIEGSQKDIAIVTKLLNYTSKHYVPENILKYYKIKQKHLKFK